MFSLQVSLPLIKKIQYSCHPLNHYSLKMWIFFFLITLALIRSGLFIIQILYRKLRYVKGCCQFLLIIFRIMMSVVCWKNSEFTTTEKRFSNVQVKRKATKEKSIVIRTRKEISLDKVWSLRQLAALEDNSSHPPPFISTSAVPKVSIPVFLSSVF